jgi:hypothetical protein
MKIRTDGTELFHADGRTGGHDEVNGRFSQFCKGTLMFFFGRGCSTLLTL